MANKSSVIYQVTYSANKVPEFTGLYKIVSKCLITDGINGRL